MPFKAKPITRHDVTERRALYDQWERLAYMLAYRYWHLWSMKLKRVGYDEEDIIQLSLIALWKATGTWEAEAGATLGSYFGESFKWYVWNRINRGKVLTHFDEPEISLARIPARDGDLNRDTIDRDKLDDVTAAAFDTLNPRQLEALYWRLSDEQSLREIAERRGVTRERIRQQSNTACRKLRAGRQVA